MPDRGAAPTACGLTLGLFPNRGRKILIKVFHRFAAVQAGMPMTAAGEASRLRVMRREVEPFFCFEISSQKAKAGGKADRPLRRAIKPGALAFLTYAGQIIALAGRPATL